MVAKKKPKQAATQMHGAKAAKPKGDAIQAKPSSLKTLLSIYYPKPDDVKGRVVEPPKIPPHAGQMGISAMRGMKATGKNKPLIYAAAPVGASLVLSAALAAFFYYVISLDWLSSSMLALTFFVGLAILFYEFLEFAERTGEQ